MQALRLFVFVLSFFSSQIIQAQWTQIDSLNGKKINALAIKDNYIFAGTDDGGFYFTTNNGSNWLIANNGIPNSDVNSIAIQDNNIFLLTDIGVFLSTNNGSNWSSFANGGGIYAILIKDNSIFLGTSQGMYLSTDGGLSWNAINDGLSTNDPSVFCLTSSGNNIFAGLHGGYLSTNNGSTWVYTLHSNYGIWSLASSGNNIFAGYSFGIYLSTDNGLNWIDADNGLGTNDCNSLIISDNNIFAGIENYGVYLSTNNGTNWSAVNTGMMNNTNVYSFAISDGYLFAGSESQGVWRRPLSEMITSVELIDNQFPEAFILKQNYPNPFNPKTIIKYDLPVTALTELKVYDILGREVATLVNEEKIAGRYEIEFDGENLSSGIYFYKMQAGTFTNTKKLILLR